MSHSNSEKLSFLTIQQQEAIMKTQFDVKTGKFFISVNPEVDKELILFYEDVREDTKQRGVHVPPPLSSAVIEESSRTPEKDVWSVIEYEYLEFVLIFLEVLFRLLEDPADSSAVKKQFDQIKEWRAAEQETEALFPSTVQ